ncbi:MAG TPA: LUD domain-containing protein [Thermomicrobiales bacterium]|nr:LUD domain-containing protein [Thermomicrobiales bacterium]
MPVEQRKPDNRAFKELVKRQVADESLATALGRALPEFGRRREIAFADQDFSAQRRRVRDLKADAIERLPELVERFTAEAQAVGAVVHLAATADDARSIIVGIARSHEARTVVKSKSMVSEEILLNPALEAHGMTVVETDLGEWIMQLAGEHPSHLIAPAVHKTREQVAKLFSDEIGYELPADPVELVKVARARLRQSFIDADIGISGANVAIAETGTLVIVSNEGNGRLVTTLPPVHIALLGVEKIVPTIDDATAILKVLPRSGTGQKITSYVSFITGPSRSADIELTLTIGVHGPKEMHIVLLDNGRWTARDDEDLREALHCIRCGACSNVCPPYQVVGGHAFGHIYTGPIGLIMTALHHGLANAAGPQSLCVSCNACETVCPAEIPIPRMILDVRSRVTEEFGLPRTKDFVLGRWTNPASGARMMGAAALGASVVTSDDGVIRSIPFRKELTEGRVATPPARRPLRDRLRRDAVAGAPPLPSSQAIGLTVAYFPGCLTDRILPEIGEAVVRVLRACGCKVVFPVDQHCCGLIAMNVGDSARGRVMARQTIRMLESVEADLVLTNSTSCLAAIAQDYQHLFRHDSEWRERADGQAKRLIEFAAFVQDVAQIDADDFPPEAGAAVVTYHDACQSANALGYGEKGRRIITDLLGLELREMQDSRVCCGFGGSFSLDHPNVSTAIMRNKLANAEATAADIIVSDNPGCLMQMRGGLTYAGSRARALHIAELIAERLPPTQ